MNKHEPVLLDTKEAAALLKIEVCTIYAWMHYRQLPQSLYRKLGRKTIFIREELLNWFLEGAILLPKRKV